MAAKKKTAARKSAKPAARKRTPARPARPARAAAPRVADGLSLVGFAPSMTVSDIQKSLAWYRDVLGFKVGEKWEMEGELRGVELSAGPTMLMLGQDDWKKGRDRKKGEGFRLYCKTDQDIDEIASRAKAKGATILAEPKDQEWGMRDFSLDDPDGFHLTIGRDLKKRK